MPFMLRPCAGCALSTNGTLRVSVCGCTRCFPFVLRANGDAVHASTVRRLRAQHERNPSRKRLWMHSVFSVRPEGHTVTHSKGERSRAESPSALRPLRDDCAALRLHRKHSDSDLRSYKNSATVGAS